MTSETEPIPETSSRFTDFVEDHLTIGGELQPHTSRLGTFAPASEGLPTDALFIELFDNEEGKYHRVVCGRLGEDGFIQSMYVLVWEGGRFLDGTEVGSCEEIDGNYRDATRLITWLERLEREELISWQPIETLDY
jgi:hypothetical protein